MVDIPTAGAVDVAAAMEPIHKEISSLLLRSTDQRGSVGGHTALVALVALVALLSTSYNYLVVYNLVVADYLLIVTCASFLVNSS